MQSRASEEIPELAHAFPESAPVAAALESDGHSWYLRVHYTGLLAGFDSVYLRVGQRRQGQAWLDSHDVPMRHCAPEETTATVIFDSEEPLEGAELAFFSPIEGEGHLAWDNAGHEFGYYEVDAGTGEIQTH